MPPSGHIRSLLVPGGLGVPLQVKRRQRHGGQALPASLVSLQHVLKKWVKLRCYRILAQEEESGDKMVK